MDFKNQICNYILNLGEKSLNNDINKYNIQLQNTLTTYLMAPIKANIALTEMRIIELHNIVKNLKALNFSNDIQNLQNVLSIYGTFCDRDNMFYDINLQNRPIREAALIILCEYLNSLQGYFVGNIKTKKFHLIASTSLIYMHYIGIATQKFSWYAQNDRKNVYKRFSKKYPDVNYFIFEPNKNAAKYLLDKMLYNDPQQKLGIVEKIETAEIIIFKLYCYVFFIKQTGPKYYYQGQSRNWQGEAPNMLYFIKNNDESLTQVSPLHNKIKENKEFIKICDDLAKT